jgi:hypothetical protein
MVRHSTLHTTAYESRFYTTFPIRVHSHLGPAPFISTERNNGFALDIYQSAECPLLGLRLSIDVWASLAKAVTRFRMVVISWSIGWVALLLQVHLSIESRTGSGPELKTTGVAFHSSLSTFGWSGIAKTVTLLSIGGLVQCALTGLRPASEWMLGTAELESLPLVPVMAIFTLSLVSMIWTGLLILIQAIRWLRPPRKMGQNDRRGSHVSQLM